jgi:transcriptional regulator with XRE-family HTH domain
MMVVGGMMLTGSQVRMARAFLRWSISDLANEAGVGISTVQRIEQADGAPDSRGGNIQAVHDALIAAGIMFLPDDGNGVGVRGKTKAAGKKR